MTKGLENDFGTIFDDFFIVYVISVERNTS